MAEAHLRTDLLKNIPELEDNEKLLSDCISICKDYNVSGDNFFWIWESLRYGSSNAALGAERPTFSAASAESVKIKLVDEMKAKRLKEQKEQMNAQRRQLALAHLVRKAPRGSGSDAKLVATAAPSVSFKIPIEDRRTRKYRYMYEKISERSEILDERIDEFGELIREHYNIDDLGDPSATSEEDVVVVGRICNDPDSASASAKLSEGTIFLESSRMMGSGSRVPLRFSSSLKLRGAPQGANSIGLFPGSIVALRGRNGGGGFFAVEEILSLPLPSPSTEPPNHKAFTMAMACGPYTTEVDLEYKYFNALMEKLRSSPPSVLLLLGPFIDAAHPLIKSGEVEEIPAKIFKRRFVEPLEDFLKASPQSLILLEPSIRDILSDHPVYPQCELDSVPFNDPRIKLIPNPSRFTINDVSFGSTSVDVLFHIRNQEYAQRGTVVDPMPPVTPESSGTDPLTNSCRQLLCQRSFYPLFPVPTDLSGEVNLDVSHSDGLRLDQRAHQHAPDVLLLPSKLKQFTKMVDGTWAVNPSFLMKGTYASISVPDTPRSELRRAIRCEIVKL
ncbi:POL12 [Sanghuangporus vaninii]